MGVLNVTPDSFSDGGRFLKPDDALLHGRAMIKAGADLIDVGGESSRPGAEPVSLKEELCRVIPVIKALHTEAPDLPISIDTTKPQVAEAALAAGAGIINDISALRDPLMRTLVLKEQVPVILMHMRGEPKTMQQGDLSSKNILAEVVSFLAKRAEELCAEGFPREKICLDPGLGFGKTLDQNLKLLGQLEQLVALGYPVLVGASRKSFIRALTGGAPSERLFGTAAACACAIFAGARMIRVHEVAEMRELSLVSEAIYQRSAAFLKTGAQVLGAQLSRA